MARSSLLGCLILKVISPAGCTHTYRVTYSSIESHASINTRTERETPLVRFLNGDRVFAHRLSLSPDSAHRYDQRVGRACVMPAAAIQDSEFRSRGRGAVEGFILGGATGLRAARNLAGGDGMIGGGVFVIALGTPAGLGTLIGVASAAKDVYILDLASVEPGTDE